MINKTNPSVSLTKPVAILFDIDNTFYAYEPADEAASKALREEVEHSLQVPASSYDVTFSQARQDVKERLASTASGHSRLLYIQKSLEILGFKSNPSLCLHLEETYWRAYLENAVLFPGVLETLELFRSCRIPLGIVTDLTMRLQLKKLVYFGLEQFFDVVVTSEETGTDKPEKSNFELTLSKLQLSKESGQVWMIGDDVKSDVVGGKTIGAITFQKIDKGSEIRQGEVSPDFAFEDFRALSEFVRDYVTDRS